MTIREYLEANYELAAADAYAAFIEGELSARKAAQRIATTTGKPKSHQQMYNDVCGLMRKLHDRIDIHD